MDIRKKVCIVTGAGGIGAAIAIELARRGATAIGIVDTDQAKADALAKEINGMVSGCGTRKVSFAFVGDTTSSEFRKKVFTEMERIGEDRVRVMIPTAGITKNGFGVKTKNGTVEMYPEDKFNQVLAVNLTAPFYWGLEMQARIVKSQNGNGWSPGNPRNGVVVLIGSIIWQGNLGQCAYAASKAALRALCATMTMESVKYGVRWSIIEPGYTATPMVTGMKPAIVEGLIRNNPFGELIQPEEIAEGVMFLVGSDSTTTPLTIDGGWRPAIPVPDRSAAVLSIAEVKVA